MSEKIEDFIKKVYMGWKKSKSLSESSHLDEEKIACFLEQKLSDKDSQEVKSHILHCPDCSYKLAINLKADNLSDINVPQKLVESVKKKVLLDGQADLLEVFIRLKEKMLEVIKSSGDILVGQELIPAPLLRSRNIKEFKDEVTILKDFKQLLVEVRVLNKTKDYFDCMVRIRNKLNQVSVKDIRVTLFVDDLELESYAADLGIVAFEHVKLGKYRLEIANPEKKLANIVLEVII